MGNWQKYLDEEDEDNFKKVERIKKTPVVDSDYKKPAPKKIKKPRQPKPSFEDEN